MRGNGKVVKRIEQGWREKYGENSVELISTQFYIYAKTENILDWQEFGEDRKIL